MKHYEEVKKNIGSLDLCVVSKRRTIEQMMPFYEAGERLFAESRAQELLAKVHEMPSDVQWQFIGHLQRNKVRSVLPYVSCIQSLDSAELARVIEKEAARIDKTIDCLLEIHLALQDENKTGMSSEEAQQVMKECAALPHINVCGMMVMGPHTDDEDEIRRIFMQAHEIFLSLQNQYGTEQFHTLSMGMSDDYRIAVSCGSTMVRIGTYLFEEGE